MRKVVILTAGYGEGHNTAARSLKRALDSLGVQAEMRDLFAETYGRWQELSRRAYLGTINHAPVVWQQFYGLLDKTELLRALLLGLGKLRRALESLILKERPQALVLTYPVYSYLLEGIYKGSEERPFKQFTVVTDSITVNSVWFRPRTDYFVVPNDATAEVMRASGVNPALLNCLGFPVAPEFAAQAVNRPEPTSETGRKVLLMINFARSQAPDLLRELLRVPETEFTVTVGRDTRLMERLQEVADEAGKKVIFYGWTDQIPRLIAESHLLISKAGGATVQEALAAQTPMIISQVVPGQEEGNARLLLENGCGMFAGSNRAIAEAVETSFAQGASLWKQYHRNVCRLSRPSAAMDIARFVLQETEACIDKLQQ